MWQQSIPKTSSSQQKLIKISEMETATNLGLGGGVNFGLKSFSLPLQKNMETAP